MYFIHFENFYLSWIPLSKKHHLDPLSKENLNRGSPYISLFQNAFHSFWELLPFLNLKILSGPPFKRKFEQGFVFLIFHFFRMAENKKHFIHFENFYLSWIPKYYLVPLSNTNWTGVPLIFNFFRMAEKKAFHLFWAFYLSWIPKYYQDPLRSLFKKVSSRLPFKRKFGQGFPLYLTFSEWMKTRGSGEPVSLTWHK